MNKDYDNSCAICGYRFDLLKCSRCKSIYYCSKEHQRKHWKKHKLDCENKTLNEIPTENKRESYPITPPKTPVQSQTQSTPIKSPLKPSQSSCSSLEQSKATHTRIPRSSASFDEITPPSTPLPLEGSSEAEIIATGIESLCLSSSLKEDSQKGTMALTSERLVTPHRKPFRKLLEKRSPPYLHRTPSEDMVSVIIEDLNAYGLCVLDNFCGPQIGKAVLQEVLEIYNKGMFQDGQLVSKSKNGAQSIRSDKIMWVDGKESHCQNIGQVLNRIDNLLMRANKKENNGKLGCYHINGRTKAMVAVYPGSGTHYVKHVDNPNYDGRCVTAIYYLNLNWDVQKSGGLLRIFPVNEEDTVADIAPLFDRLLFFWSDRQNPHEVQPAYDTRYAITLWYFDAYERELAVKKFEYDQKFKQLGSKKKSSEQERALMELKKQYQLLRKKREEEFIKLKESSLC